MRALLGAVVGLAAMASSAHAAQFGISRTGPTPVILVAGDFAYGDGERFQRIATTLPKATVAFDSPGGNLLAGLKIGETMRTRGYSSLVPDGSVCASSCAIAWLGGTKRYLGATGRLGFHAASGSDGVSAGGNALVGAYMARLGLSQDAVFALTATSPDDIAWLDFSSAKQLGITVERYAGPSFASVASSYGPRRAGPVEMARGGAPARPAYARPGPSYSDDDGDDSNEGSTSHGGSCRPTAGHSGGC
jgi:hypothetical protein